MKDEIIKDIDKLIDDITGGPEKSFMDPAKLIRDIAYDLTSVQPMTDKPGLALDFEEFIELRREFDRWDKDMFVCPKCGEKYEVFFQHQRVEWDWTTPSMECTTTIKRNRHHCMNCGECFFTHGDVKFIRNIISFLGNKDMRMEFRGE